MRRRSSGSTEEDEPEEESRPQSKPILAEDVDKNKITSSADPLISTRHSETLDRRKTDKALEYTQAAQDAATAIRRYSFEDTAQGKSKVERPTGPTTVGTMNEHFMYRRSRARSPWTLSNLTVCVTLLAITLLYAIVNSFVNLQRDPKGCKNCWMSPAYAKLSGFDTEHTRFASKYSLYLYREGGVDEDTMVKGVPILFIPGNAGSYKQVRPLAAEAAHYFQDNIQNNAEMISAGSRNLDFFTVDFNEDNTAWHGQTLLDQAEYLNEAVAYILSLYHDPRRSRRDPDLPDPSSVILLGHSMGGMVARTMLVLPNYQANSINTIVTMAAPHARPPVSFDADIVHLYERVNDYWRKAYSQKWANDNPLWHVTLISVAGGGLDTIVPSDYASIASLVPETHGFTVFTSSIPNVWTGSDHLSILWCDQFRKVVIRSLIEAVNVHRPTQTKPRADRMRIFKRRYLTGMERFVEKTLPHKEPTTLLTLEDNSNSIIAFGERLILREFGRAGKPKAYLLPIPPPGTPGRQTFTLLSDQILPGGGKLEILFCSVFPLQAGQSAAVFAMDMDLSGKSSGSTRLACKNAASDIIHLPASTRDSRQAFDDVPPFSYLQYSLTDLTEHQFVAVVDKSSSSAPGWLIAEYSDRREARLRSEASLRQLLTSGLQLRLPAARPMVTEIKIPALQSSLLAYNLRLSSQTCGDSELFAPLLRQHVSEPFESKYFVNVKQASINLHGTAPFMPPPLHGQVTHDGVALQLWTDPSCNASIQLDLRLDVAGSLGKLVMRYRTLFAAFPLVIVALVLRKQFMVHDQTGTFITFSESLDLCLRSSLPVFLLALSFLAMSITASSPSSPVPTVSWGSKNATSHNNKYSRNDLLLGSQDSFFWLLIPLFGLISVGIVVLVHYAALAVIHLLYLLYSLVSVQPSWIRNDDRRHHNPPTFAPASPRRRALTTAILLLLVGTLIPYQFAYLVACIVQIATCTRALRVVADTQSPAAHTFANYTHSLLLLTLWILPINLPVLVVWAHNLTVHWLTPFSSHHNVLSIAPLIILVEMGTGGGMIPRLMGWGKYVTNGLFFGLAFLAAVYGVSHAWFLHGLMEGVCAWLVVVQFAGGGGWVGAGGLGGGRGKKRP